MQTLSKTDRLQLLQDEVKNCTLCTELVNHRKQTVFGVGNPDAEIMFLGEAPGVDEDKQGVPFVGRAGQLLDGIITDGMKLRREDVYLCNVLCCRPPENRTPLSDEIANCRAFLDRALEIIKPKYVCCLGETAAKRLLSLPSKQTVKELRGKVFDYNGIKVICTYHPSPINQQYAQEIREDIQFLMEQMKAE